MKNQLEQTLAQLKDIKGVVAVPDNSLYIFIAIVASILLLLGFILYKYLTRMKRSKRATPKELALQRLKNLDFADTKEVVYSFSVDGYRFVNESNKDEFEAIEQALEPYKYKKETQALPKELVERIKAFIKGIKDVS